MAINNTLHLDKALEQIKPLNQQTMNQAQSRWASIAKPLNSLGLLENVIIKIAGMTGSSDVSLDKKCVVVMCADNGVVLEGVTQTSQEVTAIVTENMTKAETSVCHMAKVAGADVIPVDIGVAREVSGRGLIVHKIAFGTNNIAVDSAMSREQALNAIEYGINLVDKLNKQGYKIIATGEMGIGNTTTSSAVLSVLLDQNVEIVTGRGAGLSIAGLATKIRIIKKAIEHNKPNPEDGIDVLSKVGGFDLAGLAGIFIGGAVFGIPIVIDGLISAAAALAAVRICPKVADYLVASHISKEPAGNIVLEALGLKPFLTCEMCLGEGTGAVACFPILDMALSVYKNMSTFSDISIKEYEKYEEL